MMTDCNDKPIKIGDRVVVVRKEDRGKILTVRAIMPGACGRPGWSCRADDAKTEDDRETLKFTLSAWLRPKEIAVVAP